MFRTLHTTLVMTAKIAALALVLAAFTTQAAGPDPMGGPSAEKPKKAKPNYVEGELLVKFKGEVSSARAEAVHGKFEIRKLRQYKSVKGLQHVRLPPGMSVEEAVAEYKKDPSVLYAEPNYLVEAQQTLPDDPYFYGLWGLDNTGLFSGTEDADINAPEAWDITTGDPNVVVAVIDTGIDYTHEDLAANMGGNTGEVADSSDSDDNDYVDDVHGINAITGTPDPMDGHGHGTLVAGVIAAVGDNGIGVTGVSWHSKLVACKMMDVGGQGSLADAIACLDYVLDLKTRGVNIVATNNSWSITENSVFGPPLSLRYAIDKHREAGILFIAAAGNGYSNNDLLPTYPAVFDLPNIIAVAATDRNDNLATFSNYGRRTVHVAAPGKDIYSTKRVLGYTYGYGTSLATPYVTGLAALLKAQDPNRDWIALKNLILAGGQDTASVADNTITGKRIRAWDTGGVGSMSCTDQIVNRRRLPVTDTLVFTGVDLPVDLAAMHINCALPNGDVTVNVTGPSGPASVVLLDDGPLGPDQVAGDGIYSNTWSPSVAGAHILTFPGGDEVMMLENYAPPSEFPYHYRDLTASGTALNLGNDEGAYIDLGVDVNPEFRIRFGGHPNGLSRLWVSSNGSMSFTEPVTTGSNVYLPELEFQTLIAPFWDALDPDRALPDGGIFWGVSGSAPNRELVVEWRNMPHRLLPDCTGAGTFQVVFFEGKAEILFNYADVSFDSDVCDGGQSATVGIQIHPSLSFSSFQRYSFNTSSLYDGLGLCWFTAQSGTRPTANGGSVTVPEDGSVGITLNGSDADGDPLHYAIVDTPAHGTLTGAPPDMTYTPDRNFDGSDSFTYIVNDCALTSDPATLSIIIDPRHNDPPVAEDSTLEVVQNTPKNGTLMATDVDSGDSLTYTIVADGTLGRAIIDNDTIGAYTYTPDQDKTGTDTVTFQVKDAAGADSSIATVTVTIDALPPPPPAAASSGGGGGCRLGGNIRPDPVLPLMGLLSLMQLLRRRWRAERPKPLMNLGYHGLR